MKMMDLRRYLSALNPQLYAFAFTLVPDELVAQQLVVDAVAADVFADPIIDEHDIDYDLVTLKLYKRIFEIGKKREAHMGMTTLTASEILTFFRLPIELRACLYLSKRESLDEEEVSYILGTSSQLIGAYKVRALEELLAFNKTNDVEVKS